MTDVLKPQIPTGNNGNQVKSTAVKISYEDFLKDYEGFHAEWVDGEVIIPMTVGYRHQKMLGFLLRVVDDFVNIYDLGVTIQAPFNIKLLETGREPDLLFIAKDRLHLLRRAHFDGASDLAVEIISPDSIQRDKVTKLKEYEEGGVKEYWIIDLDKSEALFYQLDANGKYQIIPLDSEGKYYSKEIPSFWLQVAWLWQEPLPSEATVLAQICGQDYLNYVLAQIQQAGLNLPETKS